MFQYSNEQLFQNIISKLISFESGKGTMFQYQKIWLMANKNEVNMFNSCPSGQNGHHFPDDIFRNIFVKALYFDQNFTEVCS